MAVVCYIKAMTSSDDNKYLVWLRCPADTAIIKTLQFSNGLLDYLKND